MQEFAVKITRLFQDAATLFPTVKAKPPHSEECGGWRQWGGLYALRFLTCSSPSLAVRDYHLQELL